MNVFGKNINIDNEFHIAEMERISGYVGKRYDDLLRTLLLKAIETGMTKYPNDIIEEIIFLEISENSMIDLDDNNFQFLVKINHGWRYFKYFTGKSHKKYMIYMYAIEILSSSKTLSENNLEKIRFVSSSNGEQISCYGHIGVMHHLISMDEQPIYQEFTCFGNGKTSQLIRYDTYICFQICINLMAKCSIYIDNMIDDMSANIHNTHSISFYVYCKPILSETIYNINTDKEINDSVTSYIMNEYDKIKSFFTNYSECLRIIYYIFLPEIRLINIERKLLLDELEQTDNVINILDDEQIPGSVEILPILMLRAVVFEQTLLHIRKVNSFYC